MNNISSKFKYTVDLGLTATKTTFKLKKSRKDNIVHILLVVFIAMITGMLIYDITRDASIVLDVIILIALVCVEIFTLVMPFIILMMQRKFLKQLNLAEIEYTITEIVDDKCTESYYKAGKIVMQNVADLSKLIAYKIDGNYIFAVFDNFACAIFDTTTLSVPVTEVTQVLDAQIIKNQQVKNKKHKS